MGTTLSPKGLLIAFEGIDGAGKTTQARNLARHLREMGISVVDSKEPTNGPFGQQLRQSAESGRLSPQDELDLFVKDRREHVRNLIQPGLDAGSVVIVDRYYFSTAAYQGARGMDFEEILRLNEDFAPKPDLLFILQVDPAVGRTRIAARGDRANLFEGHEALTASAAIFDRIRPPYAVHLDGNKTIGELEHIVLLAITPKIEAGLPQASNVRLNISATALTDEANKVLSDDGVAVADKAQALLARLGLGRS